MKEGMGTGMGIGSGYGTGLLYMAIGIGTKMGTGMGTSTCLPMLSSEIDHVELIYFSNKYKQWAQATNAHLGATCAIKLAVSSRVAYTT